MVHELTRNRLKALAVGLGLAISVTTASAGAPTPVRPISAQVYSGRWYEIARTPNRSQSDCHAATSDFIAASTNDFQVVETCHRGVASGPTKVIRARARILSAGDNTRFRISFFGGLIHQDYWVLDHADDNSWIIMGTPGGHYVWIMSRRPAMASGSLAAATAHVAALGYAPSTLMFPDHRIG